jgi:hypothetical protein
MTPTAHPALPAQTDLGHPPRCADGDAPANGLACALQQLALAEAMTGPCQSAALCQTLTELAHVLSQMQAYDLAENYLTQALRWAVVMGSVDSCGDLHCALAEVATNAAELAEKRRELPAAVYRWQDRARGHAIEAAGLAGHATDPHWELKLLLRASDVLDRCGDHADALHLQQRALLLRGLYKPDLPAADGAPGAAAPSAWRNSPPSQLM